MWIKKWRTGKILWLLLRLRMSCLLHSLFYCAVSIWKALWCQYRSTAYRLKGSLSKWFGLMSISYSPQPRLNLIVYDHNENIYRVQMFTAPVFAHTVSTGGEGHWSTAVDLHKGVCEHLTVQPCRRRGGEETEGFECLLWKTLLLGTTLTIRQFRKWTRDDKCTDSP